MKSTYLLSIAFLFLVGNPISVNGQAPAFEWVSSSGGLGFNRGNSVATDKAGNVYVAGIYESVTDFDPGTGTNYLTPQGQLDIFIQKLDSAGNFLWVKSIGGPLTEDYVSVSVDSLDQLYITGSFKGTVDFGTMGNPLVITSAGNFDVFIQKLDTAGNTIWTSTFGGSSAEIVHDFTFDGLGNLYLTGEFYGTTDFDPDPAIFNLTAIGNKSDFFVQKLSPFGKLLWVKAMGGVGFEKGFGISTDMYGNVYTTGFFFETVDFDPGTGTTSITLSPAKSAVFVHKMDAVGNFIWVKSLGGVGLEGSCRGSGITIGSAGDVYFTGTFSSTVDFDPGPGLVYHNGPSSGSSNIFVEKLDSAGNLVWVGSYGDQVGDVPAAIVLDTADNVYITGSYSGTVDFDPGSGIDTLTSQSWPSRDIFVQKLDGSGNFIWARSVGGTGTDRSNALVLDASNNIYVTGFFEGAADFDPGPGTAYPTFVSGFDMFLLKLSQCNPTTGSLAVSACDTYTWPANSNTYTSSGAYTETLMSLSGCDSIVTLNLTIISAENYATTVSACDSYTWVVDGNIYTSSGTYSLTFTNAAGCDSILTLNLTINNSTVGSENAVGCNSYSWNGNIYNTSGIYTVSLVNAGGCDSTVTLNLTINSVDTSVTLNDLTFTSNAIGGSYQWIDCTNGKMPIPGATEQWYTLTTNGSYAVIVSENNCTDTSSCYDITTVGLSERVLTDGLKVFPNPTTGQLTLDLGARWNQVTIEVENLLGQVTSTTNFETATKVTLAIEGEPGIYFVKVRSTDGNMTTLKVLKKQ